MTGFTEAAMGGPEDNGWPEWKRLVLAKLEGLEKGQADGAQSIADLRVEMAIIKTKAGIWGGVAGVLTAAGGLVLQWLSSKKP